MPSTIEVDISTKIILPKQKMCVVHPGTKRRLLRSFLDNNAVFLEYPALDLNNRVLGDVDALRQRLRYSNAMVAARGLINPSGATIRRAAFETKPGGDVTIGLRTVRHLFTNAKLGDLVGTPTGGLYSPLLFGEIASHFIPDDKIMVSPFDYGDINYRRVQWLKTDVRTIDLPYSLASLVRKPPAVAEIARTAESERLFDYAYKSYVKGGEGWSLISAPGYDGHNPLALITPNEVIAFCVALYYASEKKADISGMSYEELIDQFYSSEEIESYGVTFASPGRLAFKSKNFKMAVFVTCAVAILTTAGIEAAHHPHVNLVSSVPANVSEMQPSEQQLNFALNAMGRPVITKAVEKAQKAKDQVGLKSDASVKVHK